MKNAFKTVNPTYILGWIFYLRKMEDDSITFLVQKPHWEKSDQGIKGSSIDFLGIILLVKLILTMY